MSIPRLIEEWETFRRRSEGITALVASMPPDTKDTLLRTPEGLSGLSLSQDSISQIWAGDSRVVLDGNEGKLLINTRYRAGIRAAVISLLCDTLTIGNLALSSVHATTLDDTLVSPGLMFDPNLELVAGLANPELGQYNVLLGDLVETTSLMEDFTEVTEKDWSTLLLEKVKKNG